MGHEAKKQKWVQDLENVLAQNVVEDAVASSLAKFDDALAKLSPSDQDLLKSYFDGTPVEHLAKAQKISKEDLSLLIKKLKQELIHHVKAAVPVKH